MGGDAAIAILYFSPGDAMQRLKLLLPVFWLLADAANALEAPVVIGEAYSLQDHSLVYREYHYSGDSDRLHRVDYRSDNGQLLARKTLDYGSGSTTPSFHQLDKRSGESVRVTRQQQSLLVEYRESEHATREQRRFPLVNSLVVDAGFDHFIRQHWSRLQTGEQFRFDFPVPSRMELVAFQLNRVKCSELSGPGAELKPNGAAVCLQIAPANMLLRWLVQPIELVYAATSPRLLVYRGLSNLADSKGEGLQVEIHYSYPKEVAALAATSG